MDKVTVKALLLAAAILSPSLIAGAREPGPIKPIRQLTADELRSTTRALNGVLHKMSVETEKSVTKPKISGLPDLSAEDQAQLK